MDVHTISEAKANLSKLIERARAGETIVIGKAGKPVVVLTAYERDATPRVLGGDWEGRVSIADDFDELPDELLAAFGADT